MLFGNRGSRSSVARRHGAFQPTRETLEDRVLLAVDLGGAIAPLQPNIATPNPGSVPLGPFGVDLAGSVQNGGAGYSVTDLGDVNNDGFDDFLIGAPSVTTNAMGTVKTGANANSAAYLVFGSQQTNTTPPPTSFNWLNLLPATSTATTGNQRVGDLGQLGQVPANQLNPITNTAGFPYSGITFTTSSNPNSQLGASVAVIRNINNNANQNALLIGAPNGLDENGANAGTGRAYLVYTSGLAAYAATGNPAPIDLDNPPTGVAVVTFENNVPGGFLGSSVAGIGDINGDGFQDIALGAPSATLAGTGLINPGVVYVLSGGQQSGGALGGAAPGIPTTTQVVNLQNVGQTTATVTTPVAGAIFLGTGTLGQAGFSVAGAHDVNGATTGGGTPLGLDDFLIGASSTGTGGTAYLIYGKNTIFTDPFNAVTTPTNNLYFYSLGALNNALSPTAATFTGLPVGSATGFAVGSAGRYDNTTPGILIGSPGNNSFTGRVDLVYGPSATAPNAPTGIINLNTPPASVLTLQLTGSTANALAGYSFASLGKVATTASNSNLLIGAPGTNNNAGAVFLLPGTLVSPPVPFTVPSLLVDAVQPLAATEIFLTNTSNIAGLQPNFGASVTARDPLGTFTQANTADQDALADFLVGAPGYNATATNARSLAGGGFIVEGAFITPNTPSNTQITTQIGVGQAISTTGVFTVNATTPPALAIFVFSNATITPAFAPLTQINPATVVVNGVAYPGATIARDPVDENNDGIPDAIITITPRSALNLTAATTTLTITGRTIVGGVNGNMSWGGTAQILVTGAVGPTPGGGTGIGGTLPIGAVLSTTLQLQYGPDTYVPPVSALSAYNYKAIPLRVAYEQFLPPNSFRKRIEQYFFPKRFEHQFGSSNPNGSNRTSTLGQKVFTRGKFKPGKTISFTHKVPVIPTSRQTETYIPTPNIKLVQKRSIT